MSKGFCFALFATTMVFAYTSTSFGTLHGVMQASRWVSLAFLCAFALSAPPRLPGSFTGGSMRIFAFIFAAVALLSALWSREQSAYTFQRGISVILLVAFIFFALWPRLRTVRDYVGLSKVLSATAWATAIASIALVLGYRGYAINPISGAWQGMFGNPNSLGMTYSILLPIALSRFYHRKKLLALALPAILFVFILKSQSRAGLLGGLFGVGAFAAAYYGRRLWIALIIMLMIAAPVLLIREEGSVKQQFQQSIMRGEASEDEYGSGRITLWLQAFERFKLRPFLGYGFGTSGDAFYPSGLQVRWHSSFTQIAVELGVVGLFFFFAPLVYSGFKVAGYHMLEVRSRSARIVVAGLIGGWFGGAVDSFFESWLFSVGNVSSLIVWVCFAAGIKGIMEARTLAGEA